MKTRMACVASIVAALVLGGCGNGKEPPATAVAAEDEREVLPAECFAKAAKEPKLAEDKDTEDDGAARDREALKKAFRYERAKRRACAERLNVLFPGKT
ncbi:MAG: hypothetical protein F9K29_24235 [Hyphomicrobiaceae bacterium]|nr:MAG: hypothetical protein F9K29_24235 [Hyphomicrobiaceae bacterium]